MEMGADLQTLGSWGLDWEEFGSDGNDLGGRDALPWLSPLRPSDLWGGGILPHDILFLSLICYMCACVH
jgi:hypothetical protein